ncbi:MAG: AMP-binding protein [Gammaproteobacteria bacterium WSBS_2016_MAG_OTU1]
MNLEGLEKNAANYVPLTPLSYLVRAARVYPHRTATIYNKRRQTWGEVFRRCKNFAAALQKNNIQRGDVVSLVAANTPEIFEAHFAVPMAGAILNAINVRLDEATLRYIFTHAETKIIFVDGEFGTKVRAAVAEMDNPPMLIDIEDDSFGGDKVGVCTYEEFIAQADGAELFLMPEDEWDPISLNYTSGTTGNPKGVVYHHRGAYLMASGSAVGWEMKMHGVLLYTVPMFHCNGWCYPWTQALLAGSVVCLRKIDGTDILNLIEQHGVDYMGGAPIILNTVIAAAQGKKLSRCVKLVTAAAPPPSSTIQAATAMGFEVMHVYGLTETYGHTTMCAWKGDLWDSLPPDEIADKMIRQGVGYPILEDWDVMNNDGSMADADGKTMGEIVMRGNTIMSGYLKNPEATRTAFADGWFHTGDLAVMHDDDYLQIKDRLKDIIISGGENISSITVENIISKHPAIVAAAVVAKADDKWGETPCAFIEFAAGKTATEEEIMEFCRENMPGFMRPRHLIFGDLPKTATGKIKKFELRERAKNL